MTLPKSPIWLVVFVALAACSFDGPPGAAPPPPSAVPAPGAAVNAAPASEPLISAPAAGRVVKQPDVTDERKQADTEDCYRFARAQVANDIRIDDDIASARGTDFTEFARISDLNRRVDSFYYEQQRGARFESCMRSKGYAAQ